MKVADENLSSYSVEFRQLPLIYTWTYRIITPSGVKYSPLGSFFQKKNAEKAALTHIRMLESAYSLSGEELKEKYGR